MEPVVKHALSPDVSFDGGDLDCGNGLLLLIRKHIDPLPRGGLLEVRSTEISVDVHLALEVVKMRMSSHSREIKPYDLKQDQVEVYSEANVF